ncbi:MAG: tetratricopeptide repeat protein [Bacteroidota bacterium]|nr:tetratricopeptide repeat protein [Bacteroidota bacterium]
MKANFYPKYIFTSFLVVVVSLVFAQGKTLDSLKQALNTKSAHDTVLCRTLSLLAEMAPDGEWEAYNDQLLKLAETNLKDLSSKDPCNNVFKKHQSDALNNKGYSAQQKGDIHEALVFYHQSLKIKEEINNQRGAASSYNNIGSIYMAQGNIQKALEYYNKSLKIKEELKDKKGVATSLNNIADIYINQGQTDKALEYYIQSLLLEKEINNKAGEAISLTNIGNLYVKKGDLEKGLEYHTKCIKLREELANKNGIGMSLNSIGTVYLLKKNYPVALEYYTKSFNFLQETGDKKNMIWSYLNMAEVYIIQKKYPQALENSSKSMSLSKELGFPLEIRNAAKQLSRIYTATGNYQKALENYELHIQMRDSISNQETRKASLKQQFKYEYEKKSTADSVAHAKENEIKNIELEKQQAEIKAKRYTQYALFGGLALMIVFAGFIFNRFKITQKQKVLIDMQKRVVEEAHKEIIDSINYAERLQRSLMASDDLLNKNIKNYFVYLNPKEAVSGDFYWASTLHNGNFCLIAADSTGHGVPGAIMSMMNMNSLKESVQENLCEPHEILNKTRSIIIETLANDGSMEGGKDGMDAALIVFNSEKTKGEFSLANNPLWLIRKGELIEYKPDKMPVGKHDRQDVPFSKQEILLEKDDLIYILTDGYADQFGGEKGKKFMYKPLKELLLSVQDKTMSEQRDVLHKRFEEWKGGMEQVDDVCIIGIKI